MRTRAPKQRLHQPLYGIKLTRVTLKLKVMKLIMIPRRNPICMAGKSFVSILLLFIILSFHSCQERDTWTSKADMPTGRLGLATAVVDGKIYAIGGYPYANGEGMTTNEVYDPKTNTWESKSPMPTGRRWMSASTVDGKIYVFGGYTNVRGPGLSTVEEYDPETDTWTAKADMPTPRLGPASCVIDGIIYVIGGATIVREQVKTVEAYNPETDTWTVKADLPTERMMLSVCAVNGKVYAIGGRYEGVTMYKWIEEYDPTNDIWTKKYEMPLEKGGFAATVLNDKIYIIGGVNVESGEWHIYPIIEEYDPKTNTFTRRKDMPTQRFGPGARAVGRKIYVIGGASEDLGTGHPGLTTVEEYIPPRN